MNKKTKIALFLVGGGLLTTQIIQYKKLKYINKKLSSLYKKYNNDVDIYNSFVKKIFNDIKKIKNAK